jgi:hypothetical protein
MEFILKISLDHGNFNQIQKTLIELIFNIEESKTKEEELFFSFLQVLIYLRDKNMYFKILKSIYIENKNDVLLHKTNIEFKDIILIFSSSYICFEFCYCLKRVFENDKQFIVYIDKCLDLLIKNVKYINNNRIPYDSYEFYLENNPKDCMDDLNELIYSINKKIVDKIEVFF